MRMEQEQPLTNKLTGCLFSLKETGSVEKRKRPRTLEEILEPISKSYVRSPEPFGTWCTKDHDPECAAWASKNTRPQ
jgi:hypothetical protein